MKEPDEEKVTQVFTVRGRPVGYQAGRWGGALVAVERGEFPVSSTGFRSVCGLAAESVTPSFLEELARNHEREREGLLQRLREARKPVGDPIGNYIHVSGAYEQAIQYGFFASDRDRAALWAGAYQLLSRVDADSRFQPKPDGLYVAWTKGHCDGAVVRAREFKALLGRLSVGDFPAQMPMRLLGANAYLELPAKPGGEPKIDLGGYTAEMALELPTSGVVQRSGRRISSTSTPDQASPAKTQLGLFGSPTVAIKSAGASGHGPRIGTG